MIDYKQNRVRIPYIRMLLCVLGLLPLAGGCGFGTKSRPVVVVYSSIDKEFSEPLINQFQKEQGIDVEAVYDTEDAKSSGLLNRLIQEKDRPQCDVFLSEDLMRIAVLKKKGITAPYESPAAKGLRPEYSDPEHHWTGMSARVRVLLVNTDHPIFKNDMKPLPTRVQDLADPKYKGKTCIGNPLFGTTTVHCLAIFQNLGDEKARKLFDDMLKNEVHVVESDGDVKDHVVKGDFAFGLTDNDDAMDAIRDAKKPVKMLIPDEKGLGMLAPVSPVLIKNGPNPDNGKKFIDFILRPQTEIELAKDGRASQIPLRPDLPAPKEYDYPAFDKMQGMKVDYGKLADLHDKLVEQGYLKEWVDRNKNR